MKKLLKVIFSIVSVLLIFVGITLIAGNYRIILEGKRNYTDNGIYKFNTVRFYSKTGNQAAGRKFHREIQKTINYYAVLETEDSKYHYEEEIGSKKFEQNYSKQMKVIVNESDKSDYAVVDINTNIRIYEKSIYMNAIKSAIVGLAICLVGFIVVIKIRSKHSQ